MELIAGSRIVKAQQRVHAAVPYSEKITEVVRDLAAAGGVDTDRRCSPAATRSRTTCYVAIAADRGLCGGYNAGVQRAAEGEVKADVLAGKRLPDRSRSVARPRATSASAATRSARRFQGFTRQPRATPTPRRSASYVIDLFTRGEVDRVELVYTRFISAGIQEVVLRPLVPLTAEVVDRRRRPARPARRRGAGGGYEFEPDPIDDPRRAAAALRRGPRLRRAAQRRGVRARLPPAGDEVGDRQRRGADQEPQPDHEPGPPGHDHDRDHGDRRRRRGSRRRQAKPPPSASSTSSRSTPSRGEPR